MTSSNSPVSITINCVEYTLPAAGHTGRTLKALAKLAHDHVLERVGQDATATALEIEDEREVHLTAGDHFIARVRGHHAVLVLINRKPYVFEDPLQSGHSLKQRAGIPTSDVLFLNRPKEDEVIPDDLRIKLRTGERFHSAPPANYGHAEVQELDTGYAQSEVLAQPDGWTWLRIPDYPLNDGYAPRTATLMVKLPPSFPDGAPDMFWLFPAVRTAAGAAPQGTSPVAMLGLEWQQFSWHLQPGSWVPGVSTLRDYLRCVRARLEKRN
jgi:hypothetical protein